MFNWNVEEMKLLNENTRTYIGQKRIYSCEYTTSKEDKIAFIDTMQQGKMTYLLNLIEKFNKEKNDLPKDNWGYVKTVSLKAWLKRNDELGLVDNSYQYGRIRFLSLERHINNVDSKYMYDTFANLVDECFHRQLVECEQMEKTYFLSHDEYSILKKEFREYADKHGTTFNVAIMWSSNGKVYVYETMDKKREITIDELKLLIGKYNELEAFIDSLSFDINIVY